MPNRERQNPLSTLQLALQLQEIIKNQQMGPEQDLMNWERLVGSTYDLPTPDRDRILNQYRGFSRMDPNAADRVSANVEQQMEAKALQALAQLESQFEQRQHQAVSGLKELPPDPENAIGELLPIMAEKLGGRNRTDMDVIRRQFGRSPAVMQRLKDLESLYGAKGTQFNFMDALMQGRLGRIPGALEGKPSAQSALGEALARGTYERLPYHQAVSGLEIESEKDRKRRQPWGYGGR